jgi:hypothetical protein
MASHSVAKLKVATPPLTGHGGEFTGWICAETPTDTHRSAHVLGCIRGVRFALIAEIIAGLCAYGVWRLFQG